MDDVISAYISLIAKLEEEMEEIRQCMQGDLLEKYIMILKNEREKIQQMLKTLM